MILQPPDSIFIPSGWDTEKDIIAFTNDTVAGNLEVPLESLLPLPPKTSQDTLINETKTVPLLTMDEFLKNLLAKNSSILQKDRPNKKQHVSLPSTQPSGSVSRQSVVDSSYTNGFGTTRDVVPRNSVVNQKTTEGSPETARTSTARRHIESAPSARGDTESLRQFFQTLLTKQPGTTQGGTTTRSRQQSGDVLGSSTNRDK